jgi:hypothetical protein
MRFSRQKSRWGFFFNLVPAPFCDFKNVFSSSPSENIRRFFYPTGWLLQIIVGGV